MYEVFLNGRATGEIYRGTTAYRLANSAAREMGALLGRGFRCHVLRVG